MMTLKVWLYFKGRRLEEGLWSIGFSNKIQIQALLKVYEVPYVIKDNKFILTIDFEHEDICKNNFDAVLEVMKDISGYDHRYMHNMVKNKRHHMSSEERQWWLINMW
jgi:hypothetical protein